MRLIRITYDTITPESAAQGDFADSGWIDEEGITIEPDSYDIEENWPELDDPTSDDELQRQAELAFQRAVVSLAVKQIGNCVEPSDWPTCCVGRTWYTETEPDRDYATGEETRQSYHLSGFTDDEERAIYAQLTGKASRA